MRALVGRRMQAQCQHIAKSHLDLSFQGRTLRVIRAGTLQTGAAEDSRMYLSLADFASWTHVPHSTIEMLRVQVLRKK